MNERAKEVYIIKVSEWVGVSFAVLLTAQTVKWARNSSLGDDILFQATSLDAGAFASSFGSPPPPPSTRLKTNKNLFCHWRSLKDTHSVRETLKELLMTAA